MSHKKKHAAMHEFVHDSEIENEADSDSEWHVEIDFAHPNVDVLILDDVVAMALH